MAAEQEEDGAAQGAVEVAPEAAEAVDALEEAVPAENGNLLHNQYVTVKLMVNGILQ